MKLLRGRSAEQKARRHLESHGLRFIAANVHSRLGEIDLIMHDGEELVLVEVRSRSEAALVDAATSITPGKQRRIIAATLQWLSRNPQWAEHPLRFDVVALDGSELRWLRNAFDAA